MLAARAIMPQLYQKHRKMAVAIAALFAIIPNIDQCIDNLITSPVCADSHIPTTNN